MKNSTMRFIILIALFFWELPQTVLGLLVFAIMKSRRKITHIEKEDYRIFVETSETGVSLGWLIFWSPAGNRFAHLVNDCRMHENGHARQSLLLGPFYLLVVGIPSLTRVLYGKWYRRRYGHSWNNYFNGFPENWADKLGGVTIPKA